MRARSRASYTRIKDDDIRVFQRQSSCVYQIYVYIVFVKRTCSSQRDDISRSSARGMRQNQKKTVNVLEAKIAHKFETLLECDLYNYNEKCDRKASGINKCI